ncbi:four helix bundle protein [Maribacter aurantiacus]|uniref:Four helix bundle protein n=1 Tax=Maribacter aurantiacus TaxID=1882343 RepID=A0A5R8MDM6_9FLAO|nr:four helix bundle protein [Maribacter aurantiacus]TLF46849.1 four helix bundle protein [Maribacter aurantiacus]
MTVQKYEDLVVWQKSQDFAISKYKSFSGLKDYFYKDQIFKASVSISKNRGEGFDRKTNIDFIRFLYIATSSKSEVRSRLWLSQRLNFLNSSETQKLIDSSNEISRRIYGLINSMKNY